MGTSKSNPGATAPVWRKTRLRTKSWASTGGGDTGKGVSGVVAAAVSALGASGPLFGPAARATVQRLGGLLSGFAEDGIDETLGRSGLRDLVGRSGFDVLEGLLDYLVGGESEDAAAQAAVRDLLEEMQTLDLLDEDAAVDADTAERLFISFFGYYLTARILFVVGDVLERVSPGEEAARREVEIRDYVVTILRQELEGTSVFDVDLGGDEGALLADNIAAQVVEVFGESS